MSCTDPKCEPCKLRRILAELDVCAALPTDKKPTKDHEH